MLAINKKRHSFFYFSYKTAPIKIQSGKNLLIKSVNLQQNTK